MLGLQCALWVEEEKGGRGGGRRRSNFAEALRVKQNMRREEEMKWGKHEGKGERKEGKRQKEEE